LSHGGGLVEQRDGACCRRECGDPRDFLLSRNSARFGAELPQREVPNLGCERTARMPSAGIILTWKFLVRFLPASLYCERTEDGESNQGRET